MYVHTFNKIPEPRPYSALRKVNPRNTSVMQRLYKRNRRRAVRLIMGDTQGTCELDPEILAEHFFPENNATPDSIFTALSKASSQVDTSCWVL